jgi:hypothetical protein
MLTDRISQTGHRRHRNGQSPDQAVGALVVLPVLPVLLLVRRQGFEPRTQ